MSGVAYIYTQRRINPLTGLNVNIMTQCEYVLCLVIAIIVAFVVVIHLQCLVSVYLSLVKIKYSVCVCVCVSCENKQKLKPSTHTPGNQLILALTSLTTLHIM